VRGGPDASSMTVLEEERKMTSGLSLGDRYITPEYLAPLPTSLSVFTSESNDGIDQMVFSLHSSLSMNQFLL